MNKKYHKLLFSFVMLCTTSWAMAQTIDLSSLEASINNLPTGTTVSWHTATPPSSGNKVADPSAAAAGTTYYAYFYDSAEDCYSTNGTAIPTLGNACPSNEVDLSSLEANVNNLPTGTSITWHTAQPADGTNLVADAAAINTAGIYYSAFYDATDDCYSTNSTPALVGIQDCNISEDTPTLCSDGIDNDGNGVSDCEDPDCLAILDFDCDGDGVTNGDETADNTDPKDNCSFNIASATVAPSDEWNALDCDGDGVPNGQEVTDGTDPASPCDVVVANITLPVTEECNEETTVALCSDGIDNDGNGLTDCEEPSCIAITTFDCDGDGVPNGQEQTDGTNPSDPCDFNIASATATPSAEWNTADCDGDGVTNGQEVTDGTNPSDPCDVVAANITLPVTATANCCQAQAPTISK